MSVRLRAGPPQFPPHHRHVPCPLTPGIPHGCASRLFAASVIFAPISRGSALPCRPATGRLTNNAAGFASCDGPHRCSPERAFGAGPRPSPFPGQAASLLLGLLAATPNRTPTGRRRRAYEHEDPPWPYVTVSPPRSAGRTKKLNACSSAQAIAAAGSPYDKSHVSFEKSYECESACPFDIWRLRCYVQCQINLGNLVVKMGTASGHAVYRPYLLRGSAVADNNFINVSVGHK
jgi:hypothetical protein